MILVITNNEDIYNIIVKYEDYNNILFEKDVTNIVKFVNEDFLKRSIENIERIYIDVSILENSNEDIITSILKLKIIYNMHIIIIAMGYSNRNELLSCLFENGIYNYITSNDLTMQDEEMRKAIKGNNYIDAIKFKSENVKHTKAKKFQKVVKVEKYGKIFYKLKDKLKQFWELIKNNSEKILKVIIYIIAVFFAIIGLVSICKSEIREILLRFFN